MRDHPRILLARVRLGQQTTRILGKDVSSWMEYEQPNPNEVEGGRRMSQRNKEKEGKSAIIKFIYFYRTQDPRQDINPKTPKPPCLCVWCD